MSVIYSFRFESLPGRSVDVEFYSSAHVHLHPLHPYDSVPSYPSVALAKEEDGRWYLSYSDDRAESSHSLRKDALNAAIEHCGHYLGATTQDKEVIDRHTGETITIRADLADLTAWLERHLAPCTSLPAPEIGAELLPGDGLLAVRALQEQDALELVS